METIRLGEKLGTFLNGGEIICLHGDIGVGKTCLAQGIICGAGVTDDKNPRSPTFSIINRYCGRFFIYHLDLYRLDTREDIFEAGVEDLVGEGVMLIEWAEKINYLTLPDKIDITIQAGDNDFRDIFFETDNEKLLASLKLDLL